MGADDAEGFKDVLGSNVANSQQTFWIGPAAPGASFSIDNWRQIYEATWGWFMSWKQAALGHLALEGKKVKEYNENQSQLLFPGNSLGESQ